MELTAHAWLRPVPHELQFAVATVGTLGRCMLRSRSCRRLRLDKRLGTRGGGAQVKKAAQARHDVISEKIATVEGLMHKYGPKHPELLPKLPKEVCYLVHVIQSQCVDKYSC